MHALAVIRDSALPVLCGEWVPMAGHGVVVGLDERGVQPCTVFFSCK